MKKEFDTILADLRNTLDSKIAQLSQRDNFDAYDQGRINNILHSINRLENSGKEILRDYSNNQDLLINFRKRAFEITSEINELM